MKNWGFVFKHIAGACIFAMGSALTIRWLNEHSVWIVLLAISIHTTAWFLWEIYDHQGDARPAVTNIQVIGEWFGPSIVFAIVLPLLVHLIGG